ncbi:MAG: hypothetical protein M3R00_05095, partial [Pseudomonadota bacterium]|nr:hypothetical protein [Pseudomonadota bacterium]
YTLLPTEKHCKLRYEVNAVFLLDKSRQYLLKNSYNQFLFECIGEMQVNFAQSLSDNTELWKQAMRVISFEIANTEEDHASAFKRGFQVAATNIRFLKPFQQGLSSIALASSLIDTTNLVYGFKLSQCVTPNLVHPEIEDKALILEHGIGTEVPFDHVCRALENTVVTLNLKAYIHLLGCLFSLSKGKNKNQILTILKGYKLFVCQDGIYRKSQGIFIPTLPSKPLRVFQDAIKLPRLHDALTIENRINTDAGILTWFKELELLEPTHHNIIDKHISVVIHHFMNINSFTADYVACIRYLYRAHNDHCDLNRYPNLQTVPLMSIGKKMIPANRCLFSRQYGTEMNFEQGIQEDIFIVADYLELDKSRPHEVKRFLKKIGVMNGIDLRQRDISVEEFMLLYPSVAKSYLKDEVGRIHATYVKQHLLTQFTYIDYMQMLGNAEYQELFFTVFRKRWNRIRESADSCEYRMSEKSRRVRLFISYYLAEHAKFLTTNQRKLPLSQTFDPVFKVFIEDDIPVALGCVELSDEQLKFLQITQILPMPIIIGLLQRWQSDVLDDNALAKYEMIYRLLLKPDYNFSDIDQLWDVLVLLPAADKSHKELQNLQCFNVNDEPPPHSGKWIKQPPKMTRNDMLALCTKLNISIITERKIDRLHRKVDEALLRLIMERLPYYALYLQKHTFRNLPIKANGIRVSL